MSQNLRTIEPPRLVGLNSINTPGGAGLNDYAPGESLEFTSPTVSMMTLPATTWKLTELRQTIGPTEQSTPDTLPARDRPVRLAIRIRDVRGTICVRHRCGRPGPFCSVDSANGLFHARLLALDH